MKAAKIFLMFLLALIFLQSCSILAPEQQVVDTFEQIAKLEDKVNKHHATLVRLEREQTTLYGQITSLGMKQFNKVAELSKEAQTIIDKREKEIDAEHENIKRAHKMLPIAKENAERLHESAIKACALRLINVMEKRYAAYDSLYTHYQKALLLERELYRLFEQENVTLEQLQKQTEKINRVYAEVVAANNQFNDYTEEYNEAKKKLYNELQ
ncbi:YkyA family protein [Anoxybacteroides tepidamans]|uniref:YkyA family protein n=1 Tax=Anoxybacteroides tepidamans TaxID=265948 RepID=UPI000483EA38|nr:YkyA family protein [Anoxybacillus tepidamans]